MPNVTDNGERDLSEQFTGEEASIYPMRPEWLALHKESAIEPDLPIIDPHHHLWHRDKEPYLLPQFLKDVYAGHNIIATVHVECHANYFDKGPQHLRPVGETAYICKIAAECETGKFGPSRIGAGIVGHADLRMGVRVAELLDAHIEAGQGRFRGIRQIVAWHPDPRVKCTLSNPPPSLLMDPTFREGFAALAHRGLSYDCWAVHTQLDELADLAAAYPNTPIVAVHAGGAIRTGPYAGCRDRAFQEWRAALRRLARQPNVYVKVGGFGICLWGFNEFYNRPRPASSEELASAWRPFIETCIETFGADRCMFESDSPVDRGLSDYLVIWNAFKHATKGYSPAERDALFHRTAAKAYRVD